jgi:3-dehydroquinate synthase
MSDMSATVSETPNGFAVAGYEKINYDFQFLDNVFAPINKQLADCYLKWGRVLAVMDENMKSLYGSDVKAYFDHYNLPLTIHAMPVGEKAKTVPTLLGIVDAMNEFGIIRKVDISKTLPD